MSKEQRNSTTSSNEPTALTQHESGETSVIPSIEERLIQPDNSQDIILWTHARGEVIRQDEEVKDRKHQRFLEKVEMGFKIGFPVICFITGIVGMVIGGLEAGPYILGLGVSLSGAGLIRAKIFSKGFQEKDKGEKNAEE